MKKETKNNRKQDNKTHIQKDKTTENKNERNHETTKYNTK